MKDQIVKNLESLSLVKEVDGSILTRAKYQILNSEKLDEDSKQLIIDNPWIVLSGSEYDVVKNSEIEFWSYFGNNPLARFFKEDMSVEYILFKMNLI